MASKRLYTSHLLILTCTLATAYFIRNPITLKTKQTFNYPKDSLLNFTELTRTYGYISEEHTVVTDDGYLLKIFRIVQAKKCKKKRKTPVILMHGLLQSSDAWIDAGPNAGLAYLLSDACYDLWVGNQRGNYYSRRHKYLNPDTDKEFWSFSVDEIGLYDIPATVDYVLQYTGVKKVNYIGYSQGAGTFFIMCSERPEYCEKANVLITLAPAARQTNTKSVVYRLMTTSMNKFSNVLSKCGFNEVFSKGSFGQEFLAFLCRSPVISEHVCDPLIGMFDSYHPGSITSRNISVMFGHFPAGTSLQNMARYGQSMCSPKFEKYNYGKDENLRLYLTVDPPEYNLSAVTLPVVVLYGHNDHLVDTKDVRWLLKKLPNVIDAEEVKDPLWNHLDVTYSHYGKELIFPKIDEYLSKFSNG